MLNKMAMFQQIKWVVSAGFTKKSGWFRMISARFSSFHLLVCTVIHFMLADSQPSEPASYFSDSNSCEVNIVR